MRDIVSYNMVSATDIDTFLVAMHQCIEDGWQPFGGLSHSSTVFSEEDGNVYSETNYVQAIVKYA